MPEVAEGAGETPLAGPGGRMAGAKLSVDSAGIQPQGPAEIGQRQESQDRRAEQAEIEQKKTGPAPAGPASAGSAGWTRVQTGAGSKWECYVEI